MMHDIYIRTPYNGKHISLVAIATVAPEGLSKITNRAGAVIDKKARKISNFCNKACENRESLQMARKMQQI